MIEDTCQTLGVALHRGKILLRLGSVAVIAEAVLRVGQAAVRVSDLWLTGVAQEPRFTLTTGR